MRTCTFACLSAGFALSGAVQSSGSDRWNIPVAIKQLDNGLSARDK